MASSRLNIMALLAVAVFVAGIAVPPVEAKSAKQLYASGKDKFTMGDLPGAAEDFKGAISEDSKFIDAYKALFAIFDQQGKLDDATALASGTIKKYGVDIDIDLKSYLLYKLADLNVKRDDIIEAEENLKQAFRLNDTDPQYKLIKAAIAKRKSDLVEEVKAKALSTVESGDLSGAISIIQQGLRYDSSNSDLRRMLGEVKSRLTTMEKEEESRKYLARIKAKMKAQDWDGAIEAIDEAITAQPENQTFSQLRSQADEERRRQFDELEARRKMEEDEKNKSARIDYFFKLGRSYMDDENWSMAIEAFNNVLKIDPSNTLAERGSREAQEAMRLDDSIKAGQRLFAEGKWIDAAEKFKYVISKVPSSKKCVALLAKTYIETQRYDEAIAVYSSYLKNNDRDIRLYAEMGDIYSLKGDFDKALEMYRKYTGEVPGDLEVAMKVGKCYTDLKRYEEAVSFFKTAESKINKNEDKVKILKELSDCYDRMKDWENALSTYREMLRIDESTDGQVTYFYKMGNIYYRNGQYTEALERYKGVERLRAHYLDIDEKIKDCMLKKYMPILKFIGGILLLVFLKFLMNFANPIYDWLAKGKKEKLIKNAKVFRQAGKWDKAINVCEELLKMPLELAEVKEIRLALAQSYFKSNKHDRAIQEAEKVLDMERNNKTAYKILGTVFLSRQEYDKALQQCRYVFDFDVNNVAMHEIMQECYKALNNVEELIMEYEEMVHLHPDNMQLRNILLKLKKEENIN